MKPVGGRPTSLWSAAVEDELRRLAAMGLGAGQVAAELRDRFGGNYTKAAVIGKARRLGAVWVRVCGRCGAAPARHPSARYCERCGVLENEARRREHDQRYRPRKNERRRARRAAARTARPARAIRRPRAEHNFTLDETAYIDREMFRAMLARIAEEYRSGE